ncbi:hypothetical protein Q7A_03495 [Methylophaga nitratireducenticrescens]|nr:hypothetical protein Q7A_03495 [Methylophaga nitratireducenticrescens]
MLFWLILLYQGFVGFRASTQPTGQVPIFIAFTVVGDQRLSFVGFVGLRTSAQPTKIILLKIAGFNAMNCFSGLNKQGAGSACPKLNFKVLIKISLELLQRYWHR